MPSLAAPVPVYTTTTSSPSPLTASKRALSLTSPGTTDSVATTATGSVGGIAGFFTPEAAMTAGTLTSPPDVANGWALAISSINNASTGSLYSAGTWTVTVHYVRNGGVLTGDVTTTFTAILARVDSALNYVSEIGRTTAGSVTVTTTKQSIAINVSGVQTEFLPTDYLMLLLYGNVAGALTSDTVRVHTSSTAALRISAAPNYAKIPQTTGAAAGVGASSAVLAAIQQTAGSAAGVGTPAGAMAKVQVTVGSAAGVGAASGNSAQIQGVAGSAAGVGSAQAVVAQTQAHVGTASGAGQAQGVIAQRNATVGAAAGSGAAAASGSSVIGTVGSAAGASAAQGRLAKVIGTVGTVDIGAGGSSPVTYVRPVYVFDG